MCVRGELWWVDLGAPDDRRAALVIQAESFNRSRIGTTIIAMLTSNLNRAQAPGNVLVKCKGTGLAQDSVINVSQIATIDKDMLDQRIGQIAPDVMRAVDDGIRLCLGLSQG